ncbi:MAG TPA: 3-(methylthio)propionyl-CoA ligase [Candidatus Sulfotelmatobacter sp.]|nr:3-(methylthio)propionyl-CoA ligase [Candidatus Sulfotelmatobacter sp.]
MRGLMQGTPLMISSLIDYAAQYHGDTEIVSRTIEGPIHRTNYRQVQKRAKQLANGLLAKGVKLGDRVATLAWNGYRHLEIYYAVSGIGAVLHTINPRLFPEQIEYIANHAEDQYIFVDLTFVPLLEGMQDKLKQVKGFIIMTDEAHMPQTKLRNVICYEAFVQAQAAELTWPSFDENTASSLCYTSGTTGNPKGVLYSHRSTVLHSFAACMGDVLGINSHESILVIVPLFHANAWGIPYAAAMSGTKLVFPGMAMDGKNIYELLDKEKITFSAGVPTVWLMLFGYLDQHPELKLPDLKAVVIGGSAAPRAMIQRFHDQFGARVIHAWGMTEMSPLGTTGNMLAKHKDLSFEEQLPIQLKQGRAVYGVDLKIVDDEGREMPRDGKAFGRLLVRGPWITNGYFKGEGGKVLDADNWFDTGDVATLDPDGYMQITDRSKDVIKSGGEWISSIDLENEAVGHPAVAEAAVIGVTHPKWQERPLLIVVKKKGSEVTRDELMQYLAPRIAKWWMPDDVVFVDELPHTATGKLLKTKLREQFKSYKLPTASAAE